MAGLMRIYVIYC